MAAADCLDDETVVAFAESRLSPAAEARVNAHVVACATCRTLVAEAAKYAFESGAHAGVADAGADVGEDAVGDAPTLAPGTFVGRYAIETFIGAGAAGTVYRAHDPQLKRRVALKLLRAHEALERSLREAEALARLSHPNVISVFDAGTTEGSAGAQVFIVMELVEGETLAAWLKRGSRGASEIVRAFVAAGRGLAAAHAARLVHRDFKPENVLVGSDGRVRVTDFGLARLVGGDQPDFVVAPTAVRAAAIEPTTTTAAGTPIYMAPEQLRGSPASAAADQYAFCVSLFVALHGRHPFADSDLLGRASGLLPGGVTAGEPDGTVPAALTEILQRGLRQDPASRFSSLDELCAALESASGASGRTPEAPRRRAPLAIGVAAIAVLLAAGLAQSMWNGKRGVAGRQIAAAACGDGILRAGTEECDDGNLVNGDGCTSQCLRCDETATSFAWIDGHCYTRHDAARTWNHAVRACREDHGDLVTYSRYNEIRDVWSRLIRGAATPFWIGLGPRLDDRRIREYAWVTGDPLLYTAWAPGEPKREAGLCVRQLPVAATRPGPHEASVVGPWQAGDCQESLPYVCERAGFRTRPGTGHAYRLFTLPLVFNDAKALCTSRGGHLATITDAEEQAFVGALVTLPAYIGAAELAADAGMKWITGEPLSYANYSPGEPDQADGGGCLVMLPDKLWYDRRCAGLYAALCEIE